MGIKFCGWLLLGVVFFGGVGVGGAQEDPNAQHILLVSGALAGEPREFDVPVESKVIRLQFTVQLDGETIMTVLGPSGRPFDLSAPNVSRSEAAGRRVVAVYDPMPGRWRLRLAGTGGFAASVTVQSEIYLCCLQPVAPARPAGRAPQGEEGGPPMAQVSLPGYDIETIDFKAVGEDGTVLDSLRFRQNDLSNSYTFTFLLPAPGRPFRVMARGQDATGRDYQRVWPRLFPPHPAEPTAGHVVDSGGPPFVQGENRIVRAEVLRLAEEPLLSEGGNAVGIRIKYEVRFPRDGVYAPTPQLFPERPAAGYTGALAMRPIRSLIEPSPAGGPATGPLQYLGRAGYRRDQVYRFTVDLVPNYLLFNEAQRTFCFATKAYGQASRERFEQEIKSEARVRYRISITGTDYDNRKQAVTENSYVPYTWYASALKEGARECE